MRSQNEVDDFQVDHGPCDRVVDQLVISGTDTTSLGGLSDLRSIGGSLWITHTEVLEDLEGLGGLTGIGKSLLIEQNTSLMNLSGLSGLTSVADSLRIRSNPALRDLDGLAGLGSIPIDLYIRDNAHLTRIDALSSVESVGMDITIFGNPELGDLAGLSGIRQGVRDLEIWDNDSLSDLEGLGGVAGARSLRVYGNDALTSLRGLDSLAEVANAVVIDHNDSLGDLAGLESLTRSGAIEISENDSLTRLDGLAGVTTIQGELVLVGNPALADTGGLSNLTEVGGELSVAFNHSLLSLSGFSSLERVGDRLHVIRNANLLSLHGLSALQEVGELRVRVNPSLADCSAVARLVDPIDHFDPGPGDEPVPDVADEVNLGQNFKGCNSINEVLASAPLSAINAGLTDAWFQSETDGQGVLIIVFPESQQVFLAWFTYDTVRPEDDVTAILGEPGHRWITAQGGYREDASSMTIHVASGGVFNALDPPVEIRPDGEIRLEFSTCNEGTLTYEIESIGRKGAVPIERLTLDNVLTCYMLDRPEETPAR